MSPSEGMKVNSKGDVDTWKGECKPCSNKPY